ncbi:hypothetical protein RMSM_04107 [Rhodopirellula maiorica SM1]|uniref:Uncharacterized protein n=1 Tax=Rhodopirellula maiorica SM1 TaxID=1265738 RepID=M5RYG7_9BACT|nr:hypothetical protein RMSM_04107 [Rhodopirellula maiorica SM1]
MQEFFSLFAVLTPSHGSGVQPGLTPKRNAVKHLFPVFSRGTNPTKTA